jgi:hypothetical protein
MLLGIVHRYSNGHRLTNMKAYTIGLMLQLHMSWCFHIAIIYCARRRIHRLHLFPLPRRHHHDDDCVLPALWALESPLLKNTQKAFKCACTHTHTECAAVPHLLLLCHHQNTAIRHPPAPSPTTIGSVLLLLLLLLVLFIAMMIILMSSIANKKTDQQEHHHEFSSSFVNIIQFAAAAAWSLEFSSSSGFFFCCRKLGPAKEEEEAQERVKQQGRTTRSECGHSSPSYLSLWRQVITLASAAKSIP